MSQMNTEDVPKTLAELLSSAGAFKATGELEYGARVARAFLDESSLEPDRMKSMRFHRAKDEKTGHSYWSQTIADVAFKVFIVDCGAAGTKGRFESQFHCTTVRTAGELFRAMYFVCDRML